ncbi:SigE family RNA polymerase sigma factor [Allorhizocola rhizosphaerae]|uniref:SigE family RNA polymerase sigma factor n=1 Tax=Allorhizocola rhizosphaerae TaxID=1872709 RepID=UPI000E3CC34A|nr:SigE family RNA polymerase sigma factor [Allorhizocola rhizosphaerae]
MTEDGFREFAHLRYGDLLRTAFLLTGSTHAAEDLVQTALLRAYRRRESINDPMAYMRRAMVNQRNTLWRRLTSRELLHGVLPDRAAPDSTAVVAQRAELLAALGRLPQKMRAVLVLRYWEDLSEKETAAILGCSVGSVKAQASRGLERLREHLAPRSEAGELAEGLA